jgi:hypothetical protein
VWAADATTNPSFLLPGSMPQATGWISRADGSTLSRTQNTPPFQKAVALPLVIQRRAREGVVGIRGCWF